MEAAGQRVAARDLSGAVVAEGLEALQQHGIAADYLQRLSRDEAGRWWLALRVPTVPTRDLPNPQSPSGLGLRYELHFFALEEAAKELRRPDCPDREVQQRLDLAAAQEQRTREQMAAQRKTEDDRRLAAEKEAEELAKARGHYRGQTWDQLSPWAQAFYVLAYRIKARDPQLAADLRAVAETCVPSAERNQPPAFPRGKWWE